MVGACRRVMGDRSVFPPSLSSLILTILSIPTNVRTTEALAWMGVNCEFSPSRSVYSSSYMTVRYKGSRFRGVVHMTSIALDIAVILGSQSISLAEQTTLGCGKTGAGEAYGGTSSIQHRGR